MNKLHGLQYGTRVVVIVDVVVDVVVVVAMGRSPAYSGKAATHVVGQAGAAWGGQKRLMRRNRSRGLKRCTALRAA